MKFSDAKIKSPPSTIGENKALESTKEVVNAYNNDKKGEYYLLSLDLLVPFHNQSRMFFDAQTIKDLSETIKKHGVRQPLTVMRSSRTPGKYEIISGERRFRASKLIGLNKIPCIILDEKENFDEVALIENIQREDLHPIELGRAYKKLYDSGYCKTHEDVARKLNVSRTQVTEYISFANIENSVAEKLFEKHVSDRSSLRKISSMKDEAERTLYIRSRFFGETNDQKSLEVKIDNKKALKKSKLMELTLSEGKVDCSYNNLDKLTKSEKKEVMLYLQKILSELSQN